MSTVLEGCPEQRRVNQHRGDRFFARDDNLFSVKMFFPPSSLSDNAPLFFVFPTKMCVGPPGGRF